MFRSPAVYTTYTVHETFQTRAKYQLQKSFQVINSCLLNTIIFWNKIKSDSFKYLSYFISDTMPINKHSKVFFFFFFLAVLGLCCCTDFFSGLPQWPNSKESACNAGTTGDADSIPGSGWSPGEGHGNPLQHSCLENPTDRGACWATVHRIAESDMTEVT